MKKSAEMFQEDGLTIVTFSKKSWRNTFRVVRRKFKNKITATKLYKRLLKRGYKPV